MKHFLREHRLYLSLFLLLTLAGAVLLLLVETGEVILFASERRRFWLDQLFIYGTRLGEEAVYIFLLILFLFVRMRLSVIVALLGLTTMLVSFASKAFFLHDRPALFFRKLGTIEQINLVEGIELHSGTTSFPSGHTMSAFALYSLLALLLPRAWRNWSVLFLLIALLVGFSRVYLVQHFLKDIYLGAWMGLAIALFYYYIYRFRFPRDPAHWLNRPLYSWAENRIPGTRKNRSA